MSGRSLVVVGDIHKDVKFLTNISNLANETQSCRNHETIQICARGNLSMLVNGPTHDDHNNFCTKNSREIFKGK